jgi:hypothetical protein
MDNIKIELLEIGLSVVDWIGLAQDRCGWRALVNWVMNFGFHKMLGTTEWLHNLWPLEWYSAPQSYLVKVILSYTQPSESFRFPLIFYIVRFEVFTAVTMKNGVFWNVTPCGSCINRLFGGT